ncbi:MAG TPA: PAS domain S-box protein, partial [Tepidisphaeraceae bacterium]|nr:PAS domain S-box protein [Tepidisphaeraceae bacterium]
MTRTSINPTAAAASANGVTQLDAIMDATVDGIITIDERGAISKMNKAACKIFGYRAGEIIGQNVGVLMPSPYR